MRARDLGLVGCQSHNRTGVVPPVGTDEGDKRLLTNLGAEKPCAGCDGARRAELIAHQSVRRFAQRLPIGRAHHYSAVARLARRWHLIEAQHIHDRSERQHHESNQHEREAGENRAQGAAAHVRHAQIERCHRDAHPPDVGTVRAHHLLLNHAELLLELARNEHRHNHRQRTHREGNEDNHRVACNLKRRVDIAEGEEDHYENQRGIDELALEVGRSEQQSLHKVGERHQQGKVENYAVDHIVRGGAYIGIGTGSIAPRRACVHIERSVIALAQRLMRLVQRLLRRSVQLINTQIDNAVLCQRADAIVVQGVHILRNTQRGEGDCAAASNQVAFGKCAWVESGHREALRLAWVASHQIALAFGVFGRRINQQQPIRARTHTHLNLQARTGLRKNHRHILHIAHKRHIFGRHHVAVHTRLAVRVTIVNIDVGQWRKRLRVYQVIDGSCHAAEHDNRCLLIAHGHINRERVIVCALNAQVGSVVNRARFGVQMERRNIEGTVPTVGGDGWNAHKVELCLLVRHWAAVVHYLDHVAAHAH
ncbi:hypothetical protein HRbin15_02697 [bacterium HR15]|nr:hypothetical protein HRbin15_02697 [bacterium HR15]